MAPSSSSTTSRPHSRSKTRRTSKSAATSDSDGQTEEKGGSSNDDSDDDDDGKRPLVSKPIVHPMMHPWLGVRAQMSVAWVSYSFFAPITLAISLILLEQQLDHAVTDAKKIVAASCSGLDQVASYAVSMPHYLSEGMNEGTSKEVSHVLQTAASGLDLVLTSLEGLASFVIAAMIGPYLCWLEFIASAALLLIQEALKLVEVAVEAAAKGIATVAEEAVKVINEAISIVDKIPFVNIKQISINLDSMKQVHLELADNLGNVASKLPSVDSIVKKLTDLIDTPLEDLRKLISTQIDKIDVGVDIFPVPEIEAVDFCSSGQTKFVDQAANALRQVIVWVLGAIIAGCLILGLVLAFRAWWEYRLLLASVEVQRQQFFPEDDPNPTPPTTSQLLAFYEASKSPALSLAMGSQTKEPKKAWFLNIMTHPPVFTFFFIGALGVLVVEGQLLLMSSGLRDNIEDLVSDTSGSLAVDITGSMNDHLQATSTSYSNGANSVINGVADDWNDSAGNAIASFTKFANTTIVDAYDMITDIIHTAFGWGPFEGSMDELVYCLVGSKLLLIEKALTWIHDNVNLTFPTVSDDVFLLSTTQTNAVVTEVTTGSTNSSLSTAMDSFFDRYEETLKQSRWLYLIYLAIPLIVLICASIGYARGGNSGVEEDPNQSTKKDQTKSSSTRSSTSTSSSSKSNSKRQKYQSLPKRRRGFTNASDDSSETTDYSSEDEAVKQESSRPPIRLGAERPLWGPNLPLLGSRRSANATQPKEKLWKGSLGSTSESTSSRSSWSDDGEGKTRLYDPYRTSKERW